jgi:hypothetical protein
VVQQTEEIKLQKFQKLFKINLKLFCKELQKKTEKKKEKKKKNLEKAAGKQISPEPESAHGPASHVPETVSSPPLFLR